MLRCNAKCEMQIADLKSTFLKLSRRPFIWSSEVQSWIHWCRPTTDWLLNPPAPPNPAAAARIQICILCILRRGNPALGGHFNPRLTTGKLNLRVGQTGADYGGFGERRGKKAGWAMTGCDGHCHANRFPTNSHLP